MRRLLKGQLRFMSADFEVIGITSNGQQINEIIENEGVPVLIVEMTRTISPIKDLKAIWKLYRIFKKERPIYVHTHTPKAGTLGMIAAWLANVPIRLHTVAGLPLILAKGPKRVLLNWVEKVTYFCANKVFPNSFGLYDIIIKNRFTKSSKLKVIAKGSSNGIDTSFFDPAIISDQDRLDLKKQLSISQHDFVFIYVGRIVKAKGINELVSAFKDLNKSYPNTKLLLVGGAADQELDPLKDDTINLINSYPNIISVGHQADVRPYFAIADILVFPSYREGFPNVVMQACAMNIPAIVSDINGCNEIITDQINGWIIPPKDECSLKSKMEEVYKNQDELKKMKLTIRQHIQDNYEQRFVWNEIKKEYFDLIKNNKNNFK